MNRPALALLLLPFVLGGCGGLNMEHGPARVGMPLAEVRALYPDFEELGLRESNAGERFGLPKKQTGVTSRLVRYPRDEGGPKLELYGFRSDGRLGTIVIGYGSDWDPDALIVGVQSRNGRPMFSKAMPGGQLTVWEDRSGQVYVLHLPEPKVLEFQTPEGDLEKREVVVVMGMGQRPGHQTRLLLLAVMVGLGLLEILGMIWIRSDLARVATSVRSIETREHLDAYLKVAPRQKLMSTAISVGIWVSGGIYIVGLVMEWMFILPDVAAIAAPFVILRFLAMDYERIGKGLRNVDVGDQDLKATWEGLLTLMEKPLAVGETLAYVSKTKKA